MPLNECGLSGHESWRVTAMAANEGNGIDVDAKWGFVDHATLEIRHIKQSRESCTGETL